MEASKVGPGAITTTQHTPGTYDSSRGERLIRSRLSWLVSIIFGEKGSGSGSGS